MVCEAKIQINAPKESIWRVITNIENAANTIRAIDSLEVLERPASGLVGLKWRETRKMMGKDATETMWITDAVENEYYKTRAESHGCVYISCLRITEANGTNTLSMSIESQPQTLMAKLMGVPMMMLLKGMMKKMLLKDLQDIKTAAENA